jgi:hypothetical protein
MKIALVLALASCNHTTNSDGTDAQTPPADGSDITDAPTLAGTPAANMFGAYALFPHDTSALSTTNIDGAFVSFPWLKLQPTSGAPDFSSIDSWLDAAVTAHSHITIGIQAGSATPMWVYNGDASQYLNLTEYAFQQQVCQDGKIVPIPWMSGYLAAYTGLIDAFAAHVHSNPSWDGVLAGMKITGINNTTLEVSLPYTPAQTHGTCVTTDAPSAWRDVGYTDALVNSAWQTILTHYAAGFPHQALIMDYIDQGFPAEYVNGVLEPKDNAVSTLLVNTATAMLGTRQFIIEGTGLALTSGAAPNLDNYTGVVGYQELYYVDGAPPPCAMGEPTTSTCDESVLHGALVYGIAHHMKYVELYSEDMTGYPTEIAFAHTQLAP